MISTTGIVLQIGDQRTNTKTGRNRKATRVGKLKSK